MVLRIGDVISGDPDKLFAYHTNVSVVLKNRYTGCFFRIFQFLLLFYITFIVFLYEDGYHKIEANDGVSIVHTSGAGYSTINEVNQGVWDSLDLQNTYMEGTSLFVATKTIQQLKQSKSICEDYWRKCHTKEDCYTFINETCVNQLCKGPNWCSNNQNSQRVEYNDALDHYLIWVRSYMKFYGLDREKEFSTFSQQTSVIYPNANANTYTLKSILELGQISYKEVKEEGAIVKVNILYDCLLSSSCSPKLEVKRIDKFDDNDFLGGNLVKYYYFYEGNQQYRHTYNMTGIRFIFDPKGKGKMISIEMILLQIATFFALLKLVNIIFDFCLTFVIPNPQFIETKYKVMEESKDQAQAVKKRQEEADREKERQKVPLHDHDEQQARLLEQSQDDFQNDFDDDSQYGFRGSSVRNNY